ncbi:MAG: FeoA family protein [Terriglobia bacterium]|jgi:Fe2+ transport system protein FeoA
MLNNAKFDSPLSLYDAEGQASLKVLTILGGWETRRSFNEIGIHAGDRIRVLGRAPFGGPLLIDNRGTHVAVGKQLAKKIKVEVLP